MASGLLTHDATLRAFASAAGARAARLSGAPYDRQSRLRGPQMLNRITADIDALDGLPLRLILPLIAGMATLAASFAVLWAIGGASRLRRRAGGGLCRWAVLWC